MDRCPNCLSFFSSENTLKHSSGWGNFYFCTKCSVWTTIFVGDKMGEQKDSIILSYSRPVDLVIDTIQQRIASIKAEPGENIYLFQKRVAEYQHSAIMHQIRIFAKKFSIDETQTTAWLRQNGFAKAEYVEWTEETKYINP